MSGPGPFPASQVPEETERIRRLYDKQAPTFDRSMGLWERILFGGSRRWVCTQATGDVLEIAAGTGRNLPYYADGTRVTGIELSPAMVELARGQARALGREVELRVGDAQELDFPDESFDTVVCTFSLCTIPDDRAAVREAKRVLRPGGRLLLAEHVRSPVRIVHWVQRLIEPLAIRFGGDHITREPLEHVHAEGFAVDALQRSKLGIVELVAAHKA